MALIRAGGSINCCGWEERQNDTKGIKIKSLKFYDFCWSMVF